MAASLLDIFGNASTIHNRNSSRFGKYIKLRYSDQGKLKGATIEKYLLEKLQMIYKENYIYINNQYKLCKDLNINDKLNVTLNYDYDSVSAKIDLYKKFKKRTDPYLQEYAKDYKQTYKDYKIDKSITVEDDYNLEDIEKYDELFKKIYKYELLKDKNSILRKYLQFKLEKLINMKVYYDQLYNLNVEKYDELREIFGLIFKNPPKLGEEEDILKLNENKLNFTGLEKFIVDKLEEHILQKSKENDKNFTDLEKLIVNKLVEYKLSVNNSNKKSRKTNKKNGVNVNKDDIIVLLDRENVTNKESNYLISNYNVRSYRTNNYKLRNKVKSEKDIVVKNLGKNTVDFNIVKDAQKYLSETDKYVVVYTHDHFGEVIDENDRYLNTGDYKMIELYFNIKSRLHRFFIIILKKPCVILAMLLPPSFRNSICTEPAKASGTGKIWD